MSGCHVPHLSEKNKVEPLIIRDIKEMVIDIQNVKQDILSIYGQLEGLSEHIDILRAFENECSDHDERIHDLENVMAEKRLIRLEEEVHSDRKHDMFLKDRLERLENYYESFAKTQHPRLLKQRLDVVEETLSRITEDDMKAGRQPYKCPLCEFGKIRVEPKYSVSSDGMKVRDERHFAPIEYTCKTCEGSGIVWG